ncbi:MAG: PEP-CTERM sorting domain-containing protein [Rubripirellula sp.]|nr:PEP-CTERM sorting domain-containing protein [Rubripirellula sp.]
MSKFNLSSLAALAFAILIFGPRAEGGIISTVFNVTDFSASGNEFTEIFSTGELTGTVTDVEVDLVITGSVNFTWGDDFTILIKPSGATAPALQAGGFSDLGANERISWANGASGDDGTTIRDSQSLDTEIAAPFSVSIGNGYASGGNGTWNGTLTLVGVDAASASPASPASLVPEPTSLAIFGIGALGMTGTRRRRKQA